MFSKQTYIQRRERLRHMVSSGIIVLFGNNEAPANYPANAYSPFRQDSSFAYFFGQNRSGLVGVIDVDSGTDTLYGDDIDIDDIVWYGSVDSVRDLAEQVGVAHTAPMAALHFLCGDARRHDRLVHFLPPYRHDTMIHIAHLLGLPPGEQRQSASLELIKAVVEMRSTKEPQEIEAIERACDVGCAMHTKAMASTRAGLTERYVAGIVDGTARSLASGVSFATIYTQHGEIMHGQPTTAQLEAGRLVLCDAGCELNGYCSDHTRTYPVNGRFTQRQMDVYSIVERCHDHVLQVARPGVKWVDVHFEVCRLMVEGLQQLGLMRGDIDAAIAAGAHALFLPHGLGHMMGMDVHDMEGLGQDHVGFDSEVRPSTQFGTASLRMGRRLREGFVVTDEPGIYFIPALIDNWRQRGLHTDFICYDKVEAYKDFGGIRIEDDLLITADGCRFLGSKPLPTRPAEIEAYMAGNGAC